MISVTSLDIQVLGKLDEKDPSAEGKYFIVLQVDEGEKIQSERTLGVPPQWKENQPFRFHVGSTIEIAIYRSSRLPGPPLKNDCVAKYTERGIDLIANDMDHGLTIESADKKAPSISIKLNLVFEDHAEFMKTVDKDMLRMPMVKGADGAQMATTIGGQVGPVLQKIVPIIDKFAGTHPILNAAWTVLSSAYKVMQNQIALDGDVRDLGEILREMAGVADSCPNLPEIGGAVDIIKEIGQTSLEAALLIHRYAAPSIAGKPSIFARATKHSVSSISTQVAQCTKRCKALIRTLHGRLLLDTSVRVRGIQDTQKKNDIHKWMCAPDSSPNYNAAREKRQAETGSWFIDGSEFKEWKEKPDCVLWLDGGPGCGKTITCATSIENVLASCASRPSVGYAYFFFDGTSARTELRSHENLIKSIVMQLADRCDGIPVALEEMYHACDGGHRQPDLPSLERTLLGIVDGFDVAYIVIDSLDECTERPKVLKWIQSITSTTAGKLHMLVTSRPEWDIKKALLSLSGIQQISIADYQAAKQDIRRFIDGRLSELPEWREERKKKVGDVLMRDANGMFRWVALQFDALMECESEKELDKQLHSLPQGLNETYARIFERSTRPGVLKRFLQWLAYSSSAMTVQQLAEVALIDFDSAVPVYDADQRYDSNAVLRICSGFVSEIGGTVKLAHFSVNEYLVSLESTGVPSKVEFQRRASECTAHSIIAQTCLAYLQHFDKPSSITAANIESFPLAQYAADGWVKHLHSASTDIKDYAALQELALNFFRPATRCALINWIRILDEQFYLETDTFSPPFHYACRFGLTETARSIINSRADMNVEAGYATGLVAASRNDDLETVKLLVENGPHTDTERGEMYGAALRAASYKGYLEVAELLVKNGADLNTKGEEPEKLLYDETTCHGTALLSASFQGHLEIVKILVAKGALLDTEGSAIYNGGFSNARYYGTALVLASLNGKLDIVKILVENGADLNTEGKATKSNRFQSIAWHGTALVLAYFFDNLDIIKILVENGADLNTKGRTTLDTKQRRTMEDDNRSKAWHGTALMLASLDGELDFVKILVEKGALLDTEGGKTEGENVWRGTALEAASSQGHLEIEELLTKAASDRTALRAAEDGEAPAEIPAETGEVDDEPDETPEVGGDGDGSSISANADLAVATLSFGTYHHFLIIISLVLPILLAYWMYLY